MVFSIYPTDPPAVIQDILQSAADCRNKVLFTTLVGADSTNLGKYLEFLKEQFIQNGFTFFMDVTPVIISKLGLTVNNLGSLQNYGVAGLRIDTGFSLRDMGFIANSGLATALNASTCDEKTCAEMAPLKPLGWHGFHSRPETGITIQYYLSQNDLCRKFSMPIFTYIPGEIQFRGPLRLGQPTLENQRQKNAYRNFVEIKHLCPESEVVCSEGTLHPAHLRWIQTYETEGVLTVPMIFYDRTIIPFVTGKTFLIRPEETDFSWRVDNTRTGLDPLQVVQGEMRTKGTLQMDLRTYGRYQGELHLMKRDMRLNSNQVLVAEIAAPYRSFVDCIKGNMKVKFVEL
jgi:hypothetical protein